MNVASSHDWHASNNVGVMFCTSAWQALSATRWTLMSLLNLWTFKSTSYIVLHITGPVIIQRTLEIVDFVSTATVQIEQYNMHGLSLWRISTSFIFNVLKCLDSFCLSSSIGIRAMSITTFPPVLSHGTFNQCFCSTESASMGEMQHPRGWSMELGNWPLMVQLGSTNSNGLPVLFQGSLQGRLLEQSVTLFTKPEPMV